MSQAFFSTGHVILPPSSFRTPSVVNLHLSSSTVPLLSRTNRRRLRSLTTPIRSSSNFSFDHETGKRMIGFHEIELQVRDYELDQYGVVNNSVFSNYCQHARRELLEELGLSIEHIAQPGEADAVSKFSIKFLAPLRLGDRFIVRVRISGWSAARIYFEYFMFKIPNEEPILEARTTVVRLDKNYRPTRIPSEIISKLVELLHHGEPN